MQAHTHDLPTFERPGVLAEYLGEELSGTGIQADHWWVTGDESALRASVGLFGAFELEHEHNEAGEDHSDDEGPELALPGRKEIDEFGLTARVTQFMGCG